jgi:hypothetical protein
MDDVAVCHIIIVIIITLSRWSRNTLSTQCIPFCTMHSVKLNTGTRPNTGHYCQHHAGVKNTSPKLHDIKWTQLQDDTSDVTWQWRTGGPTMSVTVMLTVAAAFIIELKLLVAPQSCLTSRCCPQNFCTHVRTHTASCSSRSCLYAAMKAHGRVEVNVRGGLAPLFLNVGRSMHWVVSLTPRSPIIMAALITK